LFFGQVYLHRPDKAIITQTVVMNKKKWKYYNFLYKAIYSIKIFVLLPIHFVCKHEVIAITVCRCSRTTFCEIY